MSAPDDPGVAVCSDSVRSANANWVDALSGEGPNHRQALSDLHGLLLRAAGHQVRLMRARVPNAGGQRLDEIAETAAHEALVAVLAKLHTFEGRSRFTTWAYKFAVLQTATEIRRYAWQHREVSVDDIDIAVDPTATPDGWATAADLADELKRALGTALTPHQRRVTVALLIQQVPIDVLAERLGTNRNALYKTVHDARVRLRAHLVASGHLPRGAR